MDLRPTKRVCSLEDDVCRDRLSEMPDEIILRILSCMPTLYAVRTVLLSRFGDLWTLVPTLNFDMYEFHSNFFQNGQPERDDFESFNLFVRNVLMLHQRISIDKMHISVELDYHDIDKDIEQGNDVKVWLRFALSRQAKEIKFYVSSQYDSYTRTIFPKLASSSLVTLELDNCVIKPELHVNLVYLKRLLLDHVRICDEAFQLFLLGCPSLQELAIVNPSRLEKLSFRAPNIDKLSFVLTDSYEVKNPRLIDCPNLKSLDFETDGRLPDIVDVASVRNICIKKFIEATDDDGELTLHKMFLRKFEGAEVFRLLNNASRPFLHTIQSLPLIQNRWKRLILELQEFRESSLLGIYQLMRNSRHIEELIIRDFEASSGVLPSEPPSSCVMPQLKTITLYSNLKSWNLQFQLIEFLLERSPALDKLVIAPIKCRLEAAQEREFLKRMSSFRRASTSARIVLARKVEY